MNTPLPEADRIIGSKELRQLVPLSTMQIWRLEQMGRFPKRIRLSSKKIGWYLQEVKDHLAQLPRGTNSKSAPKTSHASESEV